MQQKQPVVEDVLGRFGEKHEPEIDNEVDDDNSSLEQDISSSDEDEEP